MRIIKKAENQERTKEGEKDILKKIKGHTQDIRRST